MIRFNSDYTEGAHPLILERMMETNMEQTPGYGEDIYCKQAADKIRELCKAEDAYIQFLVGGTQTNTTVIASALRPYQGVIAADTGHINVHETGAIEATGHKVIALPSTDGKISAEQIDAYITGHYEDEAHEHIVQPGMVYISNPTEYGTIYKKHELEAISKVCKKHNVYLFLDGARLGYGLACRENDLDLPHLAKYCDVFYIGGTKVGALFGEAVVITNEALKKDFRYNIKQRGGMLAKGRLLGIQFLTLFEDNLYFQISAHAAMLADRLRECLEELGVKFKIDSPTNQIFPILPDAVLEELGKTFAYSYDSRIDESHSAVRFCTSWATKAEDVESLIISIRKSIDNLSRT